MNAFSASLGREWRRLRAHSRDLAMITWVPALTMAFMVWVFSAAIPYRLPIAVWDLDDSSLSRELVRMLAASPGLDLEDPIRNKADAQWQLQAMNVYAVVQIPHTFSRDIKRGAGSNVGLLHNAQLSTHSGLIQRDVSQVVGTFSAGIEMAASVARGAPSQGAQVRAEPIRANILSLFNIANNYQQFLLAAMVPALLHVFSMAAGAWSVGRELRDKSLGQWLTPVRLTPSARPAHAKAPAKPVRLSSIAAALLGKLLLPWLTLSACGSLALLSITAGLGWHIAGSLAWVALAFAVLVALSLVLGAMLAAGAMSLRKALSATALISAPTLAYSGVGFPLVGMTESARLWALTMPYTHYIQLQIGQFQMGTPISESAGVVSSLAVASLVIAALTILALRRALKHPEKWGSR